RAVRPRLDRAARTGLPLDPGAALHQHVRTRTRARHRDGGALLPGRLPARLAPRAPVPRRRPGGEPELRRPHRAARPHMNPEVTNEEIARAVVDLMSRR